MSKLWFWAAFGAAVGIVAINPAFSQTPEPTSSLDQRVDQKSQTEIIQEADDVFKEVSHLRGLPIKNSVKKEFKDRVFFRDYYLKLLNEQYPPKKKTGWEKAFQKFGFLPEGADLIKTYLDSFLKVVQGLYDPQAKTLYIADWISPGNQESTMAHELTHALQDQYFDLAAYLKKTNESTLDEQFARDSVIEGEAVAVALNYSLEDRQLDFTSLTNIADWVRLSNLMEESGQKAFGKKMVLHDVVDFPYVYGASFLQKFVKAYGWRGMSYLYKHPPSSTRQIMHPEAFFPKKNNPVQVKIEDLSAGSGAAPLAGYRKVWESTMGEYGLFLLLRQYLPEDEARRSVLGWRGDQVQVYEGDGASSLILVGYALFSGEETADDFFRSYRSLLNNKYQADIFRRADETIHWVSLVHGDEEVYVERFGRRVVFIEGTNSNQTAKVRGALWNFVPVKSRESKPAN